MLVIIIFSLNNSLAFVYSYVILISAYAFVSLVILKKRILIVTFTGQGTSVLSPAIPLGLVVVPAYIIACKSEEHIFEEHPSLYIIAFGLVVAKVTNRLVVIIHFLFIIFESCANYVILEKRWRT